MGRAPRKRRGSLARAGGGTSRGGAVLEYRTSPVAIVPKNPLNVTDLDDPPLTIAGTTLLAIDTKGRLISFAAVPPQVDSSPAWTGTTDWRPLFAAASLDPATFTETTPARTPLAFADERRAWKGTLPETKTPVTIEAAAYRGRPGLVRDRRSMDLGLASAGCKPRSRDSVQTGVILVLLVAAVVLARRNLDRAAPIAAAHSGWAC